jgi:hypothetical protein
VAARLTREALDQRPVERSRDDRDDQHEPDAKEGKMQAGRMTLLAERLLAGEQPGEEIDQFAKRSRAQAGANTHDQCHHDQPELRSRQPARGASDRPVPVLMTRARHGRGGQPPDRSNEPSQARAQIGH